MGSMGVFDDYRSWLLAGGARPNTLRARLEGVERLARSTAHGDPLRLSDMDVVRWIATVNTSWSRATYYGHAAAWARFLSSQRLPAEFIVDVPRPKARPGTPRPIARAELAAAMAACDGRTRMMFRLAGWAGLRINEIAAVHGENVTELGIFIVGKGGDQQMVPTHPLIWSESRGGFAGDAWWFPSREHPPAHVTKATVWRKMHQALVSVGSRATPHQCRHFYGTTLLEQGANIRVVQELMRHASITSTQVYTRVRDEDRRRAIAALPDVA